MRIYHWTILMFCMLGAPVAHADESIPKQPISVNIGIESFRWEETSGGQRLLRETGPRLTVGFTLDELLQGNKTDPYSIEARAYLGIADYEGQTQAGVSARTDTDYFGVNGEVMGGVRLAGSFRADLLGGLGVDTWKRDIQDGVTANGSTALGYREDYFILYGKLGPGFLFQDEAKRVYMQFGLKYPLYTYEHVYLTNIGFDSDVDLAPGKRLSSYAKLRMNWGQEISKSHFGMSIYYDSFRFGSSESKTVTAMGVRYSVHQPESRMNVLGASIDYYF